MKRFKKIVVLIICLGFVFGLALCFVACNNEPIAGSTDNGNTDNDNTGNNIKHWNEYDGLSFGYINAKDCADGNIHEGKMKADMQFELGNTYYMVIDFAIQAERDNSGTDKLHTNIEITPASAIEATIQDAATSETKKEVISGKINISLSYKIPELAEMVRQMRLIIQLKPQHSSDTRIKLSFESENSLNAVKTTTADDLIIGDYTKGLEYTETEDGGYAVSKGTAIGEKQIVIPTFKDEKYVTSIEDEAFKNCSSLISVTIGNSVSTIGNYAFWLCNSLTSVTMGDSVMSIGDYAFASCDKLPNIVIPNSVMFIGDYAFWLCGSLINATIGNSVASIGNFAFYKCSSIKNVTIGNNVVSIGNSAFEDCSSLTSMVLPDSVTSLGSSAFKYCSSLTDANIPNSVTSIGGYMFYNCSSLKTVTIPDSVTSIGENSFTGCSLLTSITIPNSVMSIGNSAFSKCNSLSSISLPFVGSHFDGSRFVHFGYIFGANNNGINNYAVPSSLKEVIITNTSSIGHYAFSGCTSLNKITIPDSVTYISEEAFKDCFGLTSVTCPIFAISYIPKEKLQTVVITSGDTIDNSAFENCGSLVSITIPNSIASIGEWAFRACNSLTDVYISDMTAWCNIKFNGLNSNPLYYAKNLYLNKQLVTDLVIPDTITTISDALFQNCSSFASVTIPNSVTSIGSSAFSYCSSLTSIEIPDSIASIGDNAFYNCSLLKHVTIPNSVTFIGGYVFDGCSSLVSITCPTIAISNIPKEKIQTVVITSGNTIDASAFENCRTLKSIIISDSVTSIGSSAFKDCNSLSSVTIGNGVKTIGSFAFSNCTYLRSIVIPDGVTSISQNTFEYCGLLSEVTIPGSVTSIAYGAFRACTVLSNITFDGTKSEWHSINKNEKWKYSDDIMVVHCTDGDLKV